MRYLTLRTFRNLAFALLVGTVFVVSQANIRAVSDPCSPAPDPWCSGQQGCDADWCDQEASTCYALGGFLCQGCYEDASCNSCAIQCAVPPE